MKYILKIILKYYLRFFAKLSIAVNKPLIIAVAGSTNKPFVKETIKKKLSESGLRVLANAKNFNTEIGLPLAILGLPSGYNSYKQWLPTILKAPSKLFSHKSTDVLVLGYGTSDPGDMKYLIKIAKPHIVIITDITQRYLEGFSDMDQLMKEYMRLIKSVPKKGYVIVNNDNPRLSIIRNKTEKNVISFSINNKADYTARNIIKNKDGISFDLSTADGESEKLNIQRHGEHHIYANIVAKIVESYVNKKIKS